jgi:uncharacterized protein (TIGR02265 family)
MTPDEFSEPPWDAPLDVDAECASIPGGATMKGMFTMPMVAEARQRGMTLTGARDRYLPFTDYPLVEHARLLIAAAGAFFPQVNVRQGLRKLGRAGARAIVETTVGRVMWTTVADVPSALELVVKAYAIAGPSTRMSLLENDPGRARLRLHGFHCFRDSNHVGNLEGILRACHARGRVAVRIEGPRVAEYLVEWSMEPPSSSSRPSAPGEEPRDP